MQTDLGRGQSADAPRQLSREEREDVSGYAIAVRASAVTLTHSPEPHIQHEALLEMQHCCWKILEQTAIWVDGPPREDEGWWAMECETDGERHSILFSCANGRCYYGADEIKEWPTLHGRPAKCTKVLAVVPPAM